MMNKDIFAQNVYRALNEELLKRMLVKYFFDKGLKEEMNGKVYPPLLQDLPCKIPQLSTKVEIVPCVEDIDPMNGLVTLGWNMFILGNQRMYLGESTHSNLNEIQVNAISTTPAGIGRLTYTSPIKIIGFIVETLSKNEKFDLSKCPKNIKPMMAPSMTMSAGLDSSGYFRSSGRPVL